MAKLTEQPGWPVLVAWIDRREREYFQRLATRLARHPTPVDQREIDEMRGYWRCAREFCKQPVKAMGQLTSEREEGDSV